MPRYRVTLTRPVITHEYAEVEVEVEKHELDYAYAAGLHAVQLADSGAPLTWDRTGESADTIIGQAEVIAVEEVKA